MSAIRAPRESALELWHPHGIAGRRATVVAGSRIAPGEGPVDLAVVSAGGRRASALEIDAAIAAAAARLPRRARGAAARGIARHGLKAIGEVLMVPPWPDSRHVVALERAPLRYAATRHLGLSAVTARALDSLASRPRLRRLLRRAAPGYGLVATRSPAPPRLRWLGDLDGRDSGAPSILQGDRAASPVAVVLRFPRGATEPDIAVKATLDASASERLAAERAALARWAPAARHAGAAVPVVHAAGGKDMLVTDIVAGRRAADLIADFGGAAAVCALAADWSLAFTRATLTRVEADAAWLERLLVGPAARVAAAVPETQTLRDALVALAARLDATTLSTCAVHDDLTLSNLVVDGATLGVLDWESATGDGIPLLDLWYVLADAVARGGAGTHARAVQALVSGDTRLPAAITALPAAHAAALRLTPDQALLGFHACWVRHADDELRRGHPGSFVDVVRVVAAQRLRWP